MDLLHAQFNNGRLSLEDIKTCLGSDFGQAWPALQKKFKKDPDGLFFNEKLESEQLKRKKYSESRSNNRSKKTYDSTYDTTYVKHMENENEIRKRSNRNTGVMSSNSLCTTDHCAVVALADDRWVRANKATEKLLMEFNVHLERQGIYEKNPADYKTHYANWRKYNKPEAGKKINYAEALKRINPSTGD